ncbi:MAG: hypothetical protein M1812_000836 [Candelaria pacifica]|nr:MAG: hypothetical protein M1812_000836 [Candelaria pacifica]
MNLPEGFIYGIATLTLSEICSHDPTWTNAHDRYTYTLIKEGLSEDELYTKLNDTYPDLKFNPIKVESARNMWSSKFAPGLQIFADGEEGLKAKKRYMNSK